MTDITRLLRDGDPVATGSAADDQLSVQDAQRIRRIAVAAVAAAAPTRVTWRRPFALAAVAVTLMVISVVAGHQIRAGRVAAPPANAALTTADGDAGVDDRRQLQFATPGGTRIIWVFDESLRLQESMP